MKEILRHFTVDPVLNMEDTFLSSLDGDMETPQHVNVSKKRTHKTNLMSSSLIKNVNNYFTINLG